MAKKKRKIAIMGFAASTFGDAPFQDRTWEIWGLNELWRNLPKRHDDDSSAWDAWFEMHPKWSFERRPGHVAWMQNQPANARPIYMQEHYPSIPASVEIPKDKLLNKFGPYFTCGPAYMLGMAILEPNVGQIGIWGIDMLHDTEYAYQRPCIDYYIGYARGKGISVYVPEASSLGKSDGLYGYDHLGPKKRRYRSVRLAKRRAEVSNNRDEALRALYTMDGSLETIQQFGVGDDIVKIMESSLEENKRKVTEDQITIIRGVLEEYRKRLYTLVSEQRENALQQMFSLDGALLELGYLLDIEKHRERRGV